MLAFRVVSVKLSCSHAVIGHYRLVSSLNVSELYMLAELSVHFSSYSSLFQLSSSTLLYVPPHNTECLQAGRESLHWLNDLSLKSISIQNDLIVKPIQSIPWLVSIPFYTLSTISVHYPNNLSKQFVWNIHISQNVFHIRHLTSSYLWNRYATSL